ncbi:restriction endonuclease subunit S [Pectobacterium brasiliense]|uniref:restriction endonuclease subunit S n=1 Tax=Pectobacterium brasiliense TaxID=180957 RepID=UPI001F1AEC40|nr:restriction endonuclease subunit S [Pectobacterium brasiliense]
MSEVKLPEGWAHTSLKEIASWGSGGTPSRKNPEYYGGNIPWVKTGDLGPKVITQTSEYITDIAVKKSSTKIFPKNSVAMAMYGATIGKTSILGINATTNQACAVGIPTEGATTSNFLYYFLNNEKNTFISKGKGGAQPNISQSLIKDHCIFLPPFEEQKLIVKKLDTLLTQVDSIKSRIEKIPLILKKIRQSVLAAAVSGKLTEDWRKNNPTTPIDYNQAITDSNFKIKAKILDKIEQKGNWLSCNIGHIFSVKSGDGLTTDKMRPAGKIPVYGGNGINGLHSVANIHDPTIIIGRVGFYCGSVHLTKGQAWITDNALIVSYLTGLVSSEYAYILLKATDLRKNMSSSAQPLISGSKIYPIKIELPPLAEQTEIVRRVEQLFAYADGVEKQVNNALERVNNLTQSILAKAFRGELTEQWRKENPELISGENSAEALLARIKAEQAAQQPQKKTRKKA